MFIYSNLATSIDGKIAPVDRSFFLLGSPEDRRHMLKLRQNCDAVLMGASTLRTFKRPCLALKTKKPPLNVILSTSLEGFSPTWEFFKRKEITRVLFVQKGLSSAKKALFSKSSTLIELNHDTDKNPVAFQIIEHLESMGVQSLLIEGGGSVMWDFVQHNLIEEYHLTLTPKVIGGNRAPTLVDGVGFSSTKILNLKLHSSRKVGSELFLVYKSKKNPKKSAKTLPKAQRNR